MLFNFRYNNLPQRLQTIYRTAAPTSPNMAHEITIDREGSVGVNDNNSPGFGQLGAQKWLWVAVVYSGGSNVQCYVDGIEKQCVFPHLGVSRAPFRSTLAFHLMAWLALLL